MASYEKLNAGWSVRFRIDNAGEFIHKRLSGYRTKKEAHEAYIKFMQEHRLENAPSYRYIPFETLYNDYFTHLKDRVKQSSYITKKGRGDKHLLPYFIKYRLGKITPAIILNWQKSLTDGGYSHSYKTSLRGLLYSIFKFAVLYRDMPSNPLDKVEGFRDVQKGIERQSKIKVWDKEQFKAFDEAMKESEVYQLFFKFLYLTGCRKGEALALTWEDLDLDKNTVSITKTMTTKTDLLWKITSPKNRSSVRTIAIPKSLASDLLAFKETHNQEPFIFFGERPLSETSVDRYFKAGIKAARLPSIRIHDLRHSHASFLISQGISIVAVAKRLGHKDIEMVLNVYSHLMPKEEKLLIDKLEW